MIEPGNSPGLPLEETDGISGYVAVRVRSCIGSAYLNSDLLIDASIFCQVDFAHPPASEQTNEAVLSELYSFESHFFPFRFMKSRSIASAQICIEKKYSTSMKKIEVLIIIKWQETCQLS